jgi:hypothetical protein
MKKLTKATLLPASLLIWLGLVDIATAFLGNFDWISWFNVTIGVCFLILAFFKIKYQREERLKIETQKQVHDGTFKVGW